MAIRIFIDQGHNPGMINAGASGNGLVESEITYQVGIYLAEYLMVDPRFEVRVSRILPDTVLGYNQASSLRQRVDMANEWPADYFVSIHVNANVNPNINGSEVYVYRENSTAYTMGEFVLDGIVEYVHTRYNQVRVNPSLYVLRRTTMPAILVELAYITNEQDAIKLKNDQQLFAYGIYRGLLNFFNFSPIQE